MTTQEENPPAPSVKPTRFHLAGLALAVALVFLLIAVTEMLSAAVLLAEDSHVEQPGNPYYRNQPWSAAYWKEMKLSSTQQFRSFVDWRRAPFAGQYINVDADGIRRTSNPNCTDDAPRVWIFGASSIWGGGSKDDQTVPSFFSRGYARAAGPVCVTNFAEDGWVSTQEVIAFELALKRARRVPDLVIFYDGHSDMTIRYQEGPDAGDEHYNFEQMRKKLEPVDDRFVYLKESNTYRMLVTWTATLARLDAKSGAQPATHRNIDQLAHIISDNYLANTKLVGSLSRAYGFRYAFFLGPTMSVSGKVLSDREREAFRLETQGQSGFVELCRTTYAMIMSAASKNVFNIANALDHISDDIFLDQVHVNPEGNQAIAERMLNTLGVGSARVSDRGGNPPDAPAR